MDTIVIATDGGEVSARALDVAIDIARDCDASLEVLAVRPPHPSPELGAPLREVDAFAGPRRIAEDAAARARAAGVRARPHTAHGDVAICIANVAETLGADLVVVGSRGIDSDPRVALGSVSRALALRSRVPVTIVRDLAEPSTAAGAAPAPRREALDAYDWTMFE